MKTKLNVWVNPKLNCTTADRVRRFLKMLPEDFETVTELEFAHVGIFDDEDQLQDPTIPKDITCIGLKIPTQPEGIRPITVEDITSIFTCLCVALRAIRRHESILGVAR